MRPRRFWGLIAVAAVVVVFGGVRLLATWDDDMPWLVWKLEGTAERGATPLPALRVAAQRDGEAIDGDWGTVRLSAALAADGSVESITEILERRRALAPLWRWWGRRTGRPWLVADCEYDECGFSGGTTVTTASGRWRMFVRVPRPGDDWSRRPDPSLAGKWSGLFVEGRHWSALVLRADGSVDGLLHPPGWWGTRDDVLIVTWGEGTDFYGSWQGVRTGPKTFGDVDPGTLQQE
ncbi:MAG: hypothetical protein K8T90_12845 [Planctomycetes bacterium]|nr:hypothetical protein [Planctomycetota bacterium]